MIARYAVWVMALGLLGAGVAGAETLLVGNKSEASVSLFDLASGRRVAVAKTDPGPHEIAVSGDGKLAVVTNYGTAAQPGNSLTVIEIENGEAVGTIDLGEYTRPHGILFMPDSRRALVTAEGAGVLLKVDIYLGVVEEAIPTGQNVSHMLAFDTSGRRAFVSNMGHGSVSLIDVEHGELLAYKPSGADAEGIAISDSNHDLWVTNRGEATVSLFDSRYLALVKKLPVAAFPIRAEMMPDDSQVLVTSAAGGVLTIIDTARREVAREIDLGLSANGGATIFGGALGDSSVPIGIEIAPDGKRVWIAHAAIDRVQELDTASWKQTRLFETGREPDAMAYSPLVVSSSN